MSSSMSASMSRHGDGRYDATVASTGARIWFAATAVCVAAGVALSVVTAVHATGGRFPNGVERAFNTFAFFTIQSNLIVGVTSLLLALKTDRPSTAFRTLRLIGVVAITVTGLVYHVALAHLLDLDSWDLVGDQLVHTVVPVLAVVGWLLFGPRRSTTGRIAALSVLFPFAWLAFTLIRGAVVHWYPYPFVDVTTLGYGKAVLNCLWVALLLFGLSAGFTAVDSPDRTTGDSDRSVRRRRDLTGPRPPAAPYGDEDPSSAAAAAGP
jgi:hypothetical protein